MLTHGKGYARRLTSFGEIVNPLGIRTVGEFPNLTETLLERGHSRRVVRKILGENWSTSSKTSGAKMTHLIL